MTKSRIVVYGGKGALGSALLNFFKSKNFWVLNVDLFKNEDADANIIVDPLQCWMEQEAHILKELENVLKEERLDAVFSVAGGWAGGNAANKDFIKHCDLMWKQSVWSSTISAAIAAKFLKAGGLLQLTGASAACEGTPQMIGYGMAKAAVHHLVKSLSTEGSGLPDKVAAVALLPVTLDTPMNRKWMPKADFSTWTTPEYIAQLLFEWVNDTSKRPKSGSMLRLVTKNGQTNVTVA